METKFEAKANVKNKRRRRGWITALIIVVVLGVGNVVWWTTVAAEHRDAMSLPIEVIDFNNLKDGIYIGEYAGGKFGWRKNEVQVTVSSGKVTEIKLISSADPANKNMEQDVLYDSVIESQSLQVDTLSGATLSSKAYLKAVEDALLKAQK